MTRRHISLTTVTLTLSALGLAAGCGGNDDGAGGGMGGMGGTPAGDGDVTLNTYCTDADGDGYGNPDICISAEEAPEGFVDNDEDPNDLREDVGPDALEVCDGVDNDDDGTVDAGACDDNATCQGEGDDIACVCNVGFSGDGASCSPLQWEKVSAGGRRIYNNSATTSHTCGIAEGQLFCWGNNSWGQLGNPEGGSSSSRPVRVGSGDDWQDVAAGGAFTCGIEAGALYCWGSNTDAGKYNERVFAVLGLGEDFDEVSQVGEPTQVGTDTDWVAVGAGTHHACGIRESAGERRMYCWGKDETASGAIGDGAEVTRNTPVEVSGDYTDWQTVDLGNRSNSCGIRLFDTNADETAEPTMWCWGEGFGNTANESEPTRFGNATDWLMSDSGAWHACGLRGSDSERKLYCGSENSHGQLGIGGDAEPTLTQVGTETDWADVSTGQGFSCGIQGGDLYCWGRNIDGELGLAPETEETCDWEHDGHIDCDTPTLVDGEVAWVDISVGTAHGCGIDEDGALYCWGTNVFGQTGQVAGSPNTPAMVSF